MTKNHLIYLALSPIILAASIAAAVGAEIRRFPAEVKAVLKALK